MCIVAQKRGNGGPKQRTARGADSLTVREDPARHRCRFAFGGAWHRRNLAQAHSTACGRVQPAVTDRSGPLLLRSERQSRNRQTTAGRLEAARYVCDVRLGRPQACYSTTGAFLPPSPVQSIVSSRACARCRDLSRSGKSDPADSGSAATPHCAPPLSRHPCIRANTLFRSTIPHLGPAGAASGTGRVRRVGATIYPEFIQEETHKCYPQRQVCIKAARTTPRTCSRPSAPSVAPHSSLHSHRGDTPTLRRALLSCRDSTPGSVRIPLHPLGGPG